MAVPLRLTIWFVGWIVIKGELTRQALAAHLERRGQLAVMQRHFGAMRGPADLSTNKAYRRA